MISKKIIAIILVGAALVANRVLYGHQAHYALEDGGYRADVRRRKRGGVTRANA
jgi:hypothetical protein